MRVAAEKGGKCLIEPGHAHAREIALAAHVTHDHALIALVEDPRSSVGLPLILTTFCFTAREAMILARAQGTRPRVRARKWKSTLSP